MIAKFWDRILDSSKQEDMDNLPLSIWLILSTAGYISLSHIFPSLPVLRDQPVPSESFRIVVPSGCVGQSRHMTRLVPFQTKNAPDSVSQSYFASDGIIRNLIPKNYSQH
ncbi:hypothetical protein Trydic_g536 [Trypoxylus dichotomus]